MLTKLVVRNFKLFREAEIELGSTVVFIGPNNSGKTSALQALALWELGVRRLGERYGDKEPPEKRPGVTINRKDLVALPVPTSTMLWRDAHAFSRAHRIRIEIVVDGVTEDQPWTCGLEFDYDNEESLSVRPRRVNDDKVPARMPVPAAARRAQVAFLPPMSGLIANELRLDPGAVAVRIGEGRTAEVLRNLCLQTFTERPEAWARVNARIESLFGVTLDEPRYVAERGEIAMSYRDRRGTQLDLTCAGRGLQQVLLLLAYLEARPGSALLLDEPDAHLEILRQRQIYQVLTEAAGATGSQIVAASHSEVILNEAADRDVVVAFVGRPHRLDDRGSQVTKALKEIGFDQYYQAEQRGWVLYLEGATDLAILRAFSRTLEHPAQVHLESPFVHYVGNQPSKAREHFHGLREAKPDLAGVGVYDSDAETRESPAPRELKWKRREIENYLAFPEVLLSYAARSAATAADGPLFARPESDRRRAAMEAAIADLVPAVAMRDLNDRWWSTTKASGEFLDRVFDAYFRSLGLANLMRKTDYHVLASLVPARLLDAQVTEVLDAIDATARAARPLVERDPEPGPGSGAP